MNEWSSEMIAAAASLLLVYLTERGEARPADLGRDILRETDEEFLARIAATGKSIWVGSVFHSALMELVRSGSISAEQDADGWIYRVNAAS